MRDIKFKVYVRFLQEVHNVTELRSDGSVMTDGYQYAIEKGAVDLMQFTGLTDKNGVDIYCGNLLAWPENSAYVFKVEFKLGCYVARCYHKGELSAVDYLNPTLIKRNNAKCPLEVIGNIHQHQELLEK
jgi:uncharacterized phage protein (TIGR01671 family)